MGAIDGGTLEDVTFSDITMRNIVNHPIFVRLSVRNRAPRDAGVATVRRVRFDDINVSGANGRYACGVVGVEDGIIRDVRSEEHTSELQSLMRTSYAVFGLKTKKIVDKSD